MLRNFCTLIAALIFYSTTYAQAPVTGIISGRILLENNTPAKNATIALLRPKDSVTLKLSVTDDNGGFEFLNIKKGDYLVSVSHIGYTKYFSSRFLVDEKKSAVDLAIISLQPGSSGLKDVVIESKKPFIERKADRMIINVESSISSAGSTALQVLEKSPGILVNEENGINLKGKSGVTVMIDGKPSPLSGADLITYLKSIPAANIERIEIITNPSARYDAAGNAGIIDIRFKKDKRLGYNGSAGVTFAQGVYSKPSANASINYRDKKWNLFSTYAISNPMDYSIFSISRKFFNPATGNTESVFDQSTFTKMPLLSNNIKTGVDFYADKKTVVGIILYGTFYSRERNGLSNAGISNANGALQYTNQTINLLTDKRQNILGNFNYKHTFDSSGKELNADIDLGRFYARPYQDIYANSYSANNAPIDASIQNSDQQSGINIKSFKADYTNPLKENGRFEAGIKLSLVSTDNDIKFFTIVNGAGVLDTNRSNHFVYTENINAAYVNYNKEFKKTGLQVGLRAEHTNTKGSQVTSSQSTNRNYVQLFPSFAVTQKLSSDNEISLSYSRRIDRPTYRQLNPFKILVDSYTYVLGDPFLKPSLSDSYQFGYTFKSKYSATFSYIRSTDVITDIFVQDDATKISSQVPANIQTFRQYDLTINTPVTIKKWMSANINASLTYNDYKSPLQGGNLTNNSLTWNANITNSFILGKKGWSAELNGFYESTTPWGLFIIEHFAQLSSGIQKVSANKKSVYRISLADMFYTNHIAVIVKYQNMDFHTDRVWDSRFVTLSYTYRFGKNTVEKARQRTSGVEDVKRRTN